MCLITFRNSFVHLDIKPANILVNVATMLSLLRSVKSINDVGECCDVQVKNGQYKLADFGLAVRVNPNGESNRTLVEEGDSRYVIILVTCGAFIMLNFAVFAV